MWRINGYTEVDVEIMLCGISLVLCKLLQTVTWRVCCEDGRAEKSRSLISLHYVYNPFVIYNWCMDLALVNNVQKEGCLQESRRHPPARLMVISLRN